MRAYLLMLGLIAVAVCAGCGESVPRIEINEISDDGNGLLTVTYTAREFFDNDIDILPQYTTATQVLAAATSGGGEGTAGLSTSQGGTTHTFVWDYKADLGVGRHRAVYFVIVPYGPDGRGRSGTFGVFPVGEPLLYTANSQADTISVVDIGAGQESYPVSVGDEPRSVLALPDESKLYVTNSSAGTVSIVDIADTSIIDTLAVGTGPQGIAASPDGSRVYVVNGGDGTVSVIDSAADPATLLDTYVVGVTPFGCSLASEGTTLFVTNSGDNTVSILLASDGTELATPITVGTSPRGIASSEKYTVVCNYDSGTISVIENAAIAADPPQVAVGLNPVAAVIDPKKEFAYVANWGSDTISVVNLKTMVVSGTIDVGAAALGLLAGLTTGPEGVTLGPEEENLYVTCSTVSKLVIIQVEGLLISKSFSVGTGPAGVTILSK